MFFLQCPLLGMLLLGYRAGMASNLTGKHRTVVLRPYHDDRLNKLISDVRNRGLERGHNRNDLVRLIAEKLTVDDVANLIQRG